MTKNNITLYNFAGKGDIINTTALPRLIKEKKPNTFIRVCCKENDKCFFNTNPFVDEIKVINDLDLIQKAAYKQNAGTYKNLGMYQNEINTWCVADNINCPGKFCLASSQIINKFFGENVIPPGTNLLPELFYTEEEKEKINQFIKENSPYVVLETESFSGQYMSPEDFIANIVERSKTWAHNLNVKIFSSFTKFTQRYPFFNLNNFNLKEVGLIIEGAESFYGIGSGMTVVSFERSLKPTIKKNIDYLDVLEYETYRKTNVNRISRNNMPTFFLNDIVTYKKQITSKKTNKKPRILWYCPHETHMKEEVKLLVDAGAEVIPLNTKPTLCESNSFWYDKCSMPEYAVNAIQTSYQNAIGVKLINEYIDCVWIASNPDLLKYYLYNFNKNIVYRVFGDTRRNVYTDCTSEIVFTNELLNKYIFSPISKTLSDAEDGMIKSNNHILEVFVSKDRLSKYKWKAENSNKVMCEVLSRLEVPFYKALYDKLNAYYPEYPKVILGLNQKNTFGDPNVFGNCDDDTYYNMMAICRVLVYMGETNLHLHYHPLEAMTIGVPVLYYAGSLIAEECRMKGFNNEYQKNNFGMYSTVAESKELINKCFNDISFAMAISENQKTIMNTVFGREKALQQAKNIISNIKINRS